MVAWPTSRGREEEKELSDNSVLEVGTVLRTRWHEGDQEIALTGLFWCGGWGIVLWRKEAFLWDYLYTTWGSLLSCFHTEIPSLSFLYQDPLSLRCFGIFWSGSKKSWCLFWQTVGRPLDWWFVVVINTAYPLLAVYFSSLTHATISCALEFLGGYQQGKNNRPVLFCVTVQYLLTGKKGMLWHGEKMFFFLIHG